VPTTLQQGELAVNITDKKLWVGNAATTPVLLLNGGPDGVFTSITDSGNLTFTGTGNRILGDFSNATQSNRVAIQTSTTNGSTVVNTITNGSGSTSAFRVFNTSTADTGAYANMSADASSVSFSSAINGAATALPLSLSANGATHIAISTNGNERMRIDSNGNLLVGQSSGSYNIIAKSVANDAGNVILSVERQSTAVSALLCYSVSQTNYNAANAANKMGRDSVTSRSLNAGGTVNASGADYAEYMVKAGDFIIAKGDVCGIDANGKLTNVFANAISFVVKSTDPSYVGGDTWGTDLEGNELESARQTVDRIAFAGQVPVNVLGATAGQYIVPVNNNGAIKGQAVNNPTFEQYQLAVGKVIAIESDGRARIIVKVA
jgi:hypothetical protein